MEQEWTGLSRRQLARQLCQWRELFEQEHCWGAGPLCGAQLRYLIDSAQGYLGGLAFSAARLAIGAPLSMDRLERRRPARKLATRGQQ